MNDTLPRCIETKPNKNWNIKHNLRKTNLIIVSQLEAQKNCTMIMENKLKKNLTNKKFQQNEKWPQIPHQAEPRQLELGKQ